MSSGFRSNKDGGSHEPRPTPAPGGAATLAVYLDQDGVMADFEQAAASALGCAPGDLRALNVRHDLLTPAGRETKEVLYSRIRGREAFYSEMPVMAGGLSTFRLFAPYLPFVLTAAPSVFKDDPHALAAVVMGKRAWCSRLLDMFGEDSFICTVNENKSRYMGRVPARYHLLVDDRVENCAEWMAAGGLAIRHVSAMDTEASFRLMERCYGPFTPARPR